MKHILKQIVLFPYRSQENRDILFSVFFMALGIYLFILANEFPQFKAEKFGPAFYPKILSGLLITVSLCIFFKNLRLVKTGDDLNGIEVTESQQAVFFAVFMAIILVFTIEKIGFVISTTIFLLLLMGFLSWRTKGFNLKNLIFVAIISTCTSMSIWFVFSIIMKVMLPTGSVFD